ncbi:GumC family protein [Ensifer adhaerens]|uniref:GumC family protein n=1 Tax=Ensifer adhaerens TaxID=106592 RepID=UPI003D064AD6
MLTIDRKVEAPPGRGQMPAVQYREARVAPRGYGIRDLFELFRRYRVVFCSLLGLALLATLLTAALLSRSYTATSAIVFDRNDVRPYEAQIELRKLERDRSVMETELDMIRSRVFVGVVVDALNLVNDADFNTYLPKTRSEHETFLQSFLANVYEFVFGAPDQATQKKRIISENVQRNRAISTLLNSYIVTRTGESLALTIRVVQSNPLKAATIADAIAEQYLSWTARKTEEATNNTVAYLRGEMANSAARIAGMERDIAAFARDSDLTFDPQDDVLRARMLQLNEQYVGLRVEEAGAAAKYNEAKQLLSTDGREIAGSAMTSTQLDRLRNEEARLERTRAQLGAKFGKNHPLVLDATNELGSVRAMIGNEAQRLVQELANNAKVAGVRAQQFQAELGLLQDKVQGRNLAEIRRRELDRDLQSEQAVYDQIVLRLGALNPERGEYKPTARIASYAEVPTKPSFPNATLVVVAGSIGSILLAVVGVIISDALENRLYLPRDAEHLLNRPNLASVPDMRKRLRNSSALYHYMRNNPESAAATAMRTLCMAWLTIDHEAGGKAVMLCSPARGDGKTTVALGMAMMAKIDGLRPIVIDLDMSAQSAPIVAGANTKETAITTPLEGTVDIKSRISSSPAYPFLEFISVRPGLMNLDVLCAELRDSYDLVIVDAPAVEEYEGVIWLASHVDSVILVCRSGVTTDGQLSSVQQRLSLNHAVVLGSVMNYCDQSA